MLLQARAIGDDVQGQWRSPGDILSLLLILSPDIIQRPFAQLVGRPLVPSPSHLAGWRIQSMRFYLSSVVCGSIP
jgi:hypothetical protein